MQNSVPVPHTISELFWLVVAIIITSLFGGGGFAAVWTLIANRKRPAAEIHESEARTARDWATTKQIELQTNVQAGDAVLRMVQQLMFTQAANDELHRENERLANENEVYEAQVRKAKALLKLHGINLDSAA